MNQSIIEKTREDYDRIAEHFSCTRQTQWQIVAQLLKKYCHAGDRILDIGCGNGRVANIADEIKLHYTGMDISERMIDIARERHAHATFVVGSMTVLPFPDASFDCTLLVASFHHLPSRASRIQTLHECARVLKPGGIVLMINWNLWQRQFWSRHLQHFLKKPHAIGDLFIPWKDARGKTIVERYYHVVTQREMQRLVRATPFRVVGQYYEYNGNNAHWWNGKNIVTVLRKAHD